MIPYGRQDVIQQDIDAVVEVLKSDFLTQGPVTPKFENALSSFTGAKYALAVNSATSALHIACLSLGLSEGDWLWTSPISFVASSNVGLFCGAKIDFVDIDSKTYNICPDRLEEKLKNASLNGRIPKVLVPVHLCGQSCDMSKIKKVCDEYNVKVIEDASHAIGGYYRDEPIGNCKYSDITVFSFHPVKIITTAEGGVALTNNENLAKKMNLHRSHGVTRNKEEMTEPSHGPWYYQQIELGYNYRMNDIQAALGISQMNRLRGFVQIRNNIADHYNENLKDLPLQIPFQLESTNSSQHLYIIRLKLKELDKSHKQIFEELRESGIGVNLHYIPIHLQPYYKSLGFKYGDFQESEKYYQEAISIPIHTGLSKDDQETVIRYLKKIIRKK